MRYNNGKGVSDISISVDNGEVKGLLGPNGAGKSTTMRSLMGFLKSSKGSLTVEGINTIENPVEAKEIIGYLPGDPQLPQNLNSKSLFKLGADMRGQSTDYAMELADKFELEVDPSIKELSKGNRQKAAIILAVLHKPKALILDEPTNHLDLQCIEWLESYLRNLNKTIICVSHDRAFLSNFTNKVFWIDRGKLRVSPRGFKDFDKWSEELLDQEYRELRNRN